MVRSSCRPPCRRAKINSASGPLWPGAIWVGGAQHITTGEGRDMESRERPAESGMVGLVDMSVDTLRELWDRDSDQQLDEALRRVTEPVGENAHAAVSAF